MFPVKRYEGVITLLSPLSHCAPERKEWKSRTENGEGENDSNNNGHKTITRLRRFRIVDDEGNEKQVPGLSGNAMKGLGRRLIVRYTQDYIQEKFGRDILEISDGFLEGIFGGGSFGSRSVVDMAAVKQLRERIPLLDLLGGNINGHPVQSALRSDFAIVLTGRTVQFYPILSAVFDREGKKRTETYKLDADTIGHARCRAEEALDFDEDRADKNQMIFHVEAIPAGAELGHGYTLLSGNKGTIACFEAMVALLLAHGVLGGHSAVGYGKFKAEYYDTKGNAFVPSTKAWDEWIDSNGPEMAAAIDEIEEILPSAALGKSLDACKWILKNRRVLEKVITQSSLGWQDLKEDLKGIVAPGKITSAIKLFRKTASLKKALDLDINEASRLDKELSDRDKINIGNVFLRVARR